MKIDREKLLDNILTGDSEDYKNILCDFNELIEENIFMLSNPHMFTENDKYDLLNSFLEICRIFGNDNRSTGTLIKRLDIN